MVVSDSAANMVKAFSLPGFKGADVDDNADEDMESDLLPTDESESQEFYDDLCQVNEHVPCFAHVLQLVVKDGLKQAGNIVKVLNKCSSIVSHVKKSCRAQLQLQYSSRFVAALNASVTKRLGRYEESRTFLMASALDPRFKLKWCTTEEYTF